MTQDQPSEILQPYRNVSVHCLPGRYFSLCRSNIFLLAESAKNTIAYLQPCAQFFTHHNVVILLQQAAAGDAGRLANWHQRAYVETDRTGSNKEGTVRAALRRGGIADKKSFINQVKLGCLKMISTFNVIILNIRERYFISRHKDSKKRKKKLEIVYLLFFFIAVVCNSRHIEIE